MNKNRRIYKILIPSLAILSAIGFLVFSGVKSTGMSYITVKGLVEGKNPIGNQGNQGVRIDGKPLEGSTKFIPKGDDGKPYLTFEMKDVSGGEAKVKVIFMGLKPDSFMEGQPVMVEGKYNPAENSIIASKLLTKCPSRYDSKDASKSSKSSKSSNGGYNKSTTND